MTIMPCRPCRVREQTTEHHQNVSLLRFGFVALAATVFAPWPAFAHTCTQGDCVNGEGVLTTPDGETYRGGFRDGLFHGHGVRTRAA